MVLPLVEEFTTYPHCHFALLLPGEEDIDLQLSWVQLPFTQW